MKALELDHVGIAVESLDEAVAIAKECPGLAYGAQVEVRPVAEQCPQTGEAAPERAPASALA